MFTQHNWFWQKENGQIYSSSKKSLIDKNNSDFMAWQKLGNSPTPWPRDENGSETDEALSEVLERYGLKLFPPTIEEVKVEITKKIDVRAEAERLKYITGGVGQAMIYQEKVAQAIEYSKAYADYKANPKANAKPNDNAYPLLSAGIGTDGATLLEVAETILHSYAIWRELSAAIEAIRLKAKSEIANAATVDEAQRIADAIEWPKPNG